jgi:hypothetical protein
LLRLKHETVADALEALATAELPPEQPRHGGKREQTCKAHPGAGTYKQKLTRCKRCHRVLDQDPPWPPPDYEGERRDHNVSRVQDALDPNDTFSSTPVQAVLIETSSLQDHPDGIRAPPLSATLRLPAREWAA